MAWTFSCGVPSWVGPRYTQSLYPTDMGTVNGLDLLLYLVAALAVLVNYLHETR